MRRVGLPILVIAVAVLLSSCGGEQMVWDSAVEQSTFAELDQAIPTLRESMMELNDTINKRITNRRQREEALGQFKAVTDFVDVLQFYYLPVLNSRALIARAYREIQHGMYTEAKDDIGNAVDLINKAALKSTENTKAGFDEVKRGLMEVSQISDANKEETLLKLSNAAKKLNILIEQIKPIVEVTEEGESLIDGQI